jgi:hypothetical protein
MTVKEALKRLAFTIQNQNKPNATDAEAFNKLVWFVNESIEQNPNKNICFAKLYIYFLIRNIKFYQSLDISQRKIHQVLDLPIEGLYSELMNEINLTELCHMINDGVNHEIIKGSLETFSIEETKLNTNAMITLALKTYSKP